MLHQIKLVSWENQKKDERLLELLLGAKVVRVTALSLAAVGCFWVQTSIASEKNKFGLEFKVYKGHNSSIFLTCGRSSFRSCISEPKYEDWAQ